MTRLPLVLTVVVLSLFAPSTAAAVRSEFFGIVQGPTLDDRDLHGMQTAARIRTDRFVLKWGWVQPHQGSFSWGSADRFIGALASHGIRAVPSLWGNPSWVAGSSSTPPIGGSAAELAWRNFLKVVVTRYGQGGSYWANGYRQRYGANATPLPIQTWQIWNEPNLTKYFAPSPSPAKYAHLLQISHDPIKNNNPKARILLAGMPGYGDVTAWDFLRSLYSVPRVKEKFAAAALHPYAPDLDHVRREINQFRDVMKNHTDGATPLWISEIAWGSAPPDRFGINKGPTGQKQMLNGAYNLILGHRKAWNVQRLFWYHWRDPQQGSGCSFCGSAGLLRYDRTRKLAFYTFKGFTGETTPPVASITSGPRQGSVTSNPSPTFAFTSNEPGSTFQCRVDTNSFKACSSPFTTAHLSDGAHSFSVRAIDAPGNVSTVVNRSFTVDTSP